MRSVMKSNIDKISRQLERVEVIHKIMLKLY